jgi:SPP1 gp7 family putative phage head morphogenesis protein
MARQTTAQLLRNGYTRILNKASKKPQTPAELADSVNLDWSVLVNPTDAQLQAIYRDGAQRALASLGVDDQDITTQVFQEAADYATTRAAEMVGMKYDAAGNLVSNPDSVFAISDTTRDDIKSAVADAIENGTPAADLADTISGLGAFSDARAMMIARTELISANNKGHMSAFKASGVVQYKAWSTAGDDDVDEEICAPNEEQGPIPLDDDFDSGDSEPPGHPNCRCTLVAVVGADAAEADEQDDEEE